MSDDGRAFPIVAWLGSGMVGAGVFYDFVIWLVLTDHNLIHPANLFMWMLGFGFLLAFGVGPLVALVGAVGTFLQRGAVAAFWTAVAAIVTSVGLWAWLLLSPTIGI